jgi:hypothetical protein
MIAKNSKHSGYKTLTRAKALDVSLGLIRTEHLNSISEKALAQLIVSRQTFLKEILPVFYNPSCESSLMTFNQIVADATQIISKNKVAQLV